MNIRNAIEKLAKNVIQIKQELKHDEAVEFILKNKYEKTPIILNVEGKKVAMNFASSRSLLCKYMGISERDFAKYLAEIKINNNIKIEKDFKLKEGTVNLHSLPILKYFKKDGGRYITGGVLIARANDAKVTDPKSYNCSIHRLMVLNKKELVARIVAPRHTYMLWKREIEREKDLPIAIAIGVHPLCLFSSATRLPFGMEYYYSNSLIKNFKLYEVDDMLVPDCEILMIGKMTGRLENEGPFVDLTGTYDKVRKQPVIEIEKLYMAEDPIYYAIIPASSEHATLMGLPYEPVIYKAVSNVCDVKNVVLTPGSRHYFHAVIQIRKITEGDAKNAILAAFAAHTSLKMVIIVDEDIDVYNHEEIEYALATRVQPDKDVLIISNIRGSSLDPSAKDGITSKWGIDATMPLSRKQDFERVDKLCI